MRKLTFIFAIAIVMIGGGWWLILNMNVEVRRRLQCKANLSQLAFQLSYVFPDDWTPRNIIDQESGVALLSWRVRVLQNVDPSLYSQFDLTEAWDSPQNRPLIKKMPRLYRCPMSDTPLDTGFPDYFTLRVTGDGHFTYESQPVLVVEYPSEIPWTKPMDLNFPSSAAARLQLISGQRFHAHVLLQGATITQLDNLDDLTINASP